MKKETTTKDRILDSALTLFAEKGYDGVGVDLIAEKAGLKGPSLYKHFKGKEEILEILIGRVEDYYEMNFGSTIHPGMIPNSMEELIEVSLHRLQFTLHDDMIKKTRRILTMEQFRNPRIAKLATSHGLERVQEMYQAIFEEMMEKGVMKKGDARMLAMSFIAPISLLIQMCDREPEREEEALSWMREYMEFFAKEHTP